MGIGVKKQSGQFLAMLNAPASLTDEERAIQAAAAQEKNRITRRSTILGGSVNPRGLRRRGATRLGG